MFAGNTTPGGRVVDGFSAQEYGRGVGTGGLEGAGAEYHWATPKF